MWQYGPARLDGEFLSTGCLKLWRELHFPIFWHVEPGLVAWLRHTAWNVQEDPVHTMDHATLGGTGHLHPRIGEERDRTVFRQASLGLHVSFEDQGDYNTPTPSNLLINTKLMHQPHDILEAAAFRAKPIPPSIKGIQPQHRGCCRGK